MKSKRISTSEILLDSYTELIEKHAQVAMKKVKKPTNYSLNDLTQEGVVVFLNAKDKYSESRGASFKTFLTRCLRNHFTSLVRRTYRNKEVYGPGYRGDNLWNDNIQKTNSVKGGNAIDTFEIVQVSFLIESFSNSELEYVNAVLSFTHKPRKSRRKAAREVLGISYEREQELRRSLRDKIRK